MNHLIIAVDGPVASGKGTVSRLVAKRLGIKYIDSGAIYRTIIYYLNQRRKILPQDVNEASFEGLNIELGEDWEFLLDGEGVGDKIRKPKISELSSDYAKVGIVREFASKIARSIAQSNECIIDGRDAGTFIVPQCRFENIFDSIIRRENEKEIRRL